MPIQYFEKGRIEYQGYMGLSGEWEYTYGLLVPEMLGEVTSANNLSISATSVTYVQLRTYADPARRVAPPAGFTGGTQKTADGENVFIPQSATLGVEAGYMVPTYFWDYMNSGVFPGGWLHDLGLPVSVPFEATVMKDSVERSVHMQAFERGILTYAPQNPDRFKVERANIGADYLAMLQQSQGGQQDPTAAAQDVVSKYWQAIDARDYETAYGMPAASYQAQITMQQFEDGLANTVAHATNVQFSNVSQLPDGTIQLTCTVDIQTGSQPSNYSTGPNTRFFTLAQEGGTWRITGITTAP